MRKALYIMGILEDTDVSWLGDNGNKLLVPGGKVLVREGEPNDSLFIVLNGELTVATRTRGEIARLRAGEIVGEISFVDSRPPSATVVASRESLVLSIPRAALRHKLEADAWFAAHFYRALATLLADRLRAAVSVGVQHGDDDDPEELDFEMMDNAARGASRFDRLMKGARTGA